MPEWLYEDGIGEARAALVEHGAILRARIELADGARRAGHVEAARLAARPDATGRATVRFADGVVALLAGTPAGLSEGASLPVEIVREAIPERGNLKPATARPAAPDAISAPGPDLAQRIAATGFPVRRLLPHEPDALEAAGWSEMLDAATTGLLPFDGGLLRLSITPAMALFDVDGSLPPADLARRGAAAAARAILALDIGGSIGIDLPTVTGKAERQAIAAAVDAVLPQPFERTTVNGFGFLQIVRRRARASLPELLAADRPESAARALLRIAERTPGHRQITLVAPPIVTKSLQDAPSWTAILARRTGSVVTLRPDPGLAISAAYVETT